MEKPHRSTEISIGHSGDVDMSHLKERTVFSSSFLAPCGVERYVPCPVEKLQSIERMLGVVQVYSFKTYFCFEKL